MSFHTPAHKQKAPLEIPPTYHQLCMEVGQLKEKLAEAEKLVKQYQRSSFYYKNLWESTIQRNNGERSRT